MAIQLERELPEEPDAEHAESVIGLGSAVTLGLRSGHDAVTLAGHDVPHMNEQNSESAAARLRRSLESGEVDGLAQLYARDALLDANLPSWRVQRQGTGAIVKQFKEWYPEPPRFVEWCERPTSWGAVVECAELHGDGADETYFRTVCLLLMDGERIGTHIVYCTGAWDLATRARHARKAPMVG
jgi:hypothetical protein